MEEEEGHLLKSWMKMEEGEKEEEEEVVSALA